MTYKLPALKVFAFATLALSQASCANITFEATESVLLKNKDQQYNHWNGIGKLYKDDRPWCTASLLDTRDVNSGTSGPAYALTAAHCISQISGPKADVPFKASIKFNYFIDTPSDYKSYEINKANWVNLASSDAAIVELTVSLDTLLKEGITLLKLAAVAPSEIGKVHIVGVPGGLREDTLQMSTCIQEPTDATVLDTIGVFTNYQKNNCNGIRGGSSGSPVIDTKTGHITGVLMGSFYNKTTGDDLCFWHALCDVKPTDNFPTGEANHSFPIDYFLSCFENGYFNADARACTLKPNFDFTSKRNSSPEIILKPVNTEDKTPLWGVEFSMSTPFYRFKTVRDAKACYSPHRYSDAISTINATIDAPIGRKEGMYYLCLLGVESSEQQPSIGLRRNTQILSARLVEPSAIKPSEPTFTLEPFEHDFIVRFREESSRSIWTQYYVGPEGETNCADIDRKHFKRVSFGFRLTAASLPQTLCSYNESRDLSKSDVRTDLLEHP